MATKTANFDELVRASQRRHRVVTEPSRAFLPPICVTCRTPWPCRDAQWGAQWLATLNLGIAECVL
ncbi:MAG TPA: hypothetical protein VIQ30_02305 [Pseudonocardia sp.]